MNFSDYQIKVKATAIYPPGAAVFYPALGLAGEVGEVSNLVKKSWRDAVPFPTSKLVGELGDCLWYLSQLCNDLGLSLDDVAQANLEKLAGRSQRGTLRGNGEDR